jgi:preprotein translocase subunit SecA
VVEDIVERHEKGQPVLVGTTSVERSEHLSKMLVSQGIPHEVLNAKNHEREAHIVARAGRKGAVTVATNMAGRGTDIMLGGNPDFEADLELRSAQLDPVSTPEEYNSAYPGLVEQMQSQVEAEAAEVREAGGLYVLGTERHESRRIDNQLRGRSGRQGDPGESRFYLSLGDELMRRFNAAMVEAVMTRLRVPDDVPIEHKMVTRAIRSAQTQVEQQNFEIRKNVLKYDEVMNLQRKVIYAERRRVLEGEDLQDQMRHMITDVVTAYVDGATSDGYAEDWDLDQLWTALKTLYPVSLEPKELLEAEEDLTREALSKALLDDANAAYDKREGEINGIVGRDDAMRELERRVLISVLDRKWREHLYEMDYLKEGIGLRAMAQRDPLVEYQREGFDMFAAMLDALKEESVGFLFNLQVEPVETVPAAVTPTELPVALTTSSDAVLGNGTGNGMAPDRTAPDRTGPNRTGPAGPAMSQLAAGRDKVPPALRGKGLGEAAERALTFSGPAEDGSVDTRRDEEEAEALQAGTRRERRAAARAQSKKGKKRT